MNCVKCGAGVPDDSMFCPKCGAGVNVQHVPVSNHLVSAILTTLFCCLPFGIVSLIYASRVDLLLSFNKIDDAKTASRKALQWVVVGIVSAFAFWALYAAVVAALGLSPVLLNPAV